MDPVASSTDLAVQLSVGAFFLLLLLPLVRSPSMFSRRYARSHRLAGLALLIALMLGFVQLFLWPAPRRHGLLCDAALSLLGVATALTAASDFGPAHDRVRNEASGTLDKEATVTRSEMIEHSFYQGLNLVQVAYLHCLPTASPRARLALVCLATAPWGVR